MKIDPLKGWHRYTELMHQQPDAKARAMLDNMRHHLKYECLADPAIFDSIVPDPEYKFYASFDNASLQGMDAVKQFYYDLWESGSSLVELAIHRCAVADWGVACDGEWWQQVPGTTLAQQGQSVDDPHATYLSHAHLSWFFPFEEIGGRMLLKGEICYIDEPGASLTRLDPQQVVAIEDVRRAWQALPADYSRAQAGTA